MAILLFFAFIAGIVTVLSPCVLPVLPALLSAGAGKGHYRPHGIILGLVLSFAFFTLTLTAIVHATGISPNFLRYIAIVLIAFFGLTMLFPTLGEWFAKATAGIADIGVSVQEKSRLVGTGFWSGFILGIALGLVWTPCAGPILAAITTLVATSSITFETVLVTLVYSFGTALPMFLIIYGGNKILYSTKALSKYTETIRKAFGVLMIVAAFAIAFHFDVVLQQFALNYFPMINVEDRPVVREELRKLKSKQSLSIADRPGHKAPDLVGITEWINSPPLSFDKLKGKVVLVDFWTYSCINCVRTLPYLKKWYEKYRDRGFVIVGVHTPEFEFEKNVDNVKDAVKRFEIKYPVAMDNNYKTWQNYDNLYWPAHYLIDQKGIVRDTHFGEGAYLETENAIRSLLGLSAVAGEDVRMQQRAITPETYLGVDRADRYHPDISLRKGETTYSYREPLPEDDVGLKGRWRMDRQYIEAKENGARLDLNFIANRVYLVMESPEEAFVDILLDDATLPKEYYTVDMNDQGQIRVQEARMYDILDLHGNYGHHTLTLIFPKGVKPYVFTFGESSK